MPVAPGMGERLARRRAANREAYGAFLKGQYYWYQWERGSVEKSVALFEDAVRGDPNYAPAWAWLSQSYQLLIMRDDGQDAAVIAKGRQAANKALALDDRLAEAHAAVASYAALDWDWSNAEQQFRKAIELNPGWSQGRLIYALMCLLPTGRTHDATMEALHARELDPLTKTTRAILAEILYFNRDYDRAIAEAQDLRTPGPGPSPGEHVYLLSLCMKGESKRALSEFSPAGGSRDIPPPAMATYGYLLGRQGEREQARGILTSLLAQSRTERISPVWIAQVSVGLGDKEEAFRQLRTAVSKHVPAVCRVGVDPIFDPLHGDPRFAEILRQIGLKP
jgi:tetratricopeptide (TPR) repeat protein